MKLGGVNVVLDFAQFSQDSELSDHHFGMIIIFHEAFDVLDGADLVGVAVLGIVNFSKGSRSYDLFDFVVFF
jgi:hypothetical protein